MEIDGYIKRRLKSLFSDSGLDAVVIMNTATKDSNFTYMTDFSSGVFEDAILLLFPDGEKLLVNKLEREIALESAPKVMEVVSADTSEELASHLKKDLKGLNVGFNAKFLPYSYYAAIRKLAKPKRMVDVGKFFSKLRTVKDEYEISRIRKANSIAKRAFSEIPTYFSAGITERQLAAKFDSLMLDAGATSPSFDTIICFGKNSALPHHSPDNSKLRENSIILIDAGAKWANYCSDLTKSFFFKPQKASPTYAGFEEMYSVVEEAQAEALAAIKAGAAASSPHITAENVIDKAYGGKYAGKFIHALGHSIGIEVHDESMISLSPRSKEILSKGMVFSDEPGIYVVGKGGVRLEEDVLVGSGSSSIL